MALDALFRLAADSLSGERLVLYRDFLEGHRRCSTMLRRGCSVVLAGKVIEILDESMKLQCLRFTPWEGLSPCDESELMTVVVPRLRQRSFKAEIGHEITLFGTITDKSEAPVWVFDDDVLLVHRTQFDNSLPINALHLFSGAFCGWSRALSWIGKNVPELKTGTQTFVDADPVVMSAWAHQHRQIHHSGLTRADATWDPSNEIGICSSVADCTVLRHCQWTTNAISTASPPCVSWSRGGKLFGMDCPQGFAAFETILLIELQQPMLVFFECADETVSHQHFPLLQNALKLIGYVQIWQQIVPLHQLTHNARTRWLAVWKRFDMSCLPYGSTLVPRAPPLTPWHSSLNHFWIPDDIRQQLQLGADAITCYGDPQLLPPAKRARLSTGSPHEVLLKRVPAYNEALPTLCCTYTKQHNLEACHLADKGIFASIVKEGDGFAFLNPLSFVPLFGATDKVSLPCDVSQAFHLLGNAIAQPHATLGLAVGLIALSKAQVQALDLVQRSWHDRLTADNAIVHRSGDWIEVHRRDDFLRSIDFRFYLLPDPSVVYVCLRTQLLLKESHRDTSVPCTSTLLQALKQILTIDECDPAAIRFISDTEQDLSEQTVETALQVTDTIRCLWHNEPFALFCRGEGRFVETVPPPEELPPTVPFSVVEDGPVNVIDCQPLSFDELRRHESFQEALTCFEHLFKVLQESTGPQQIAALAWEHPPLLFAVTIDQQDPLGCVQTQLDLLFPGKFSVFLGPGRLKQIADGPFLLVRSRNHNDDALVALVEISPRTVVHLKAVPKQICGQCKIVTPKGDFMLVTHNFRAITSPTFCFTGDILVIDRLQDRPVFAGGHHNSERPVAQLPAGATFPQRVAFAVETHGWAASDELENAFKILRTLEPNFIQACGFMRWDPALSEFDEGAFEEVHFAPLGCTCLLVLVGCHWALIQVTRTTHETRIRVAGLPQQCAQRAAVITCRMLDIAPHRAALDFDFLRPPEHMCGWTIMFQLYTKAEILDHLPDASYFWGILTIEERRQVNDMLIASQQHWTQARADPVLRGFAFQLRLDFFCQLALRGRDNDPVTTIPLDPAFPRGNPDTGATSSSLPGRPLSVRLPLTDATAQTEQGNIILQRLQATSPNPGWLFSDALDYHCELLRLHIPAAQFAPPARWHPETSELSFLNDLTCRAASFERTIVPILWEQRWITRELYRDGWDFNFIVRGPDALQPLCNQLATDVAAKVMHDGTVLHVTFIRTNPPPHLCGWTMLFDLYRRFGTLMPMPSSRLLNDLRISDYAPWHVWVHEQAVRQWGADIDPTLRTFASSGLLLHLGRIDQARIPQQYQAAGAVSSSTPTDPAVDPLTVHDPWAKKAPPSRWEDLRLGTTHPFHNEKGEQLDQLHRLQATGHNGGIVLTTKQHLSELIKLGTKHPFVALLPQLDDSSKAALGVAAHGPFEVILYDKAAGQTYKRITHAVAIFGKFNFTLKDPAAEFHTSEIAELVLEFDSRLTQKAEFDHAAANPVLFFRNFIAKHMPSLKEQITVYGFRHNRHPSATKEDDQLQIVLKVPKSARPELLQLSGADSILVRDYLQRGTSPIDVTVIPKFWPINAKALRELLIAAEKVTGIAGVLMTRRGLAVRAWSKEVAEVRKKLLPADPRLTSSNLHVVPRLLLNSSGWPPGASPADIVEAVHKAVGLPPVPTRTFRSAGVHVWQLGFESPPKVDDFTVKINGDIFQILLAPNAEPEKGSGKGKSNRKPKNKQAAEPPAPTAPPGLPAFNPEQKRLEVLEARFDTLQGQVSGIEKKQVTLETKLDSRFEEIGSTLRQLVQLSTAPRPHERTGERPPSKFSKTA